MISVVTVNRNNFEGLLRTAESVQAQDMRAQLQWIVVDGASTDGSAEWLAELTPGKLDSFVVEQDRGIYDAMNKGLKLATGDAMVYLNSGDRFSRTDSASWMLSMLRRSGREWGYAGVRRLNDHGTPVAALLPTPFSIRRFMIGLDWLPHQGVIIDRSLMLALGGFNESFGVFADQELLMRASLRSEPTVGIEFVVDMETAGASSAVTPWQFSRFFQRARRTNGVKVLPFGADGLVGVLLAVSRMGLMRGRRVSTQT